jgi:lysophospholipase L1-like esterase
MKSFIQRVGLILFGLAIAAVALEVLLQVASIFFSARPVPEIELGSKQVVLALGDSHTYGVGYAGHEVYPARLQAILNESGPDSWRVLNLGVPGMSSLEIVARLPGWLSRYRPVAVVVCVGINNIWNESRNDQPLPRLRLLRLQQILGANLAGEPKRVSSAGSETQVGPSDEFIARPRLKRTLIDEGRGGEEYRDAETGELLISHQGNIFEAARSVAEARHMLRRDLRTLLGLSNRAGASLILLTYSAFPLPGRAVRHGNTEEMNEELRAFGDEFGVPLVDTRSRFLELLGEDVARSDFFLTEKDGHPNPRGYAEIAQLIADQLETSPGRPTTGPAIAPD